MHKECEKLLAKIGKLKIELPRQPHIPFEDTLKEIPVGPRPFKGSCFAAKTDMGPQVNTKQPTKVSRNFHNKTVDLVKLHKRRFEVLNEEANYMRKKYQREMRDLKAFS